jgi:hypothetical protein
MGIADRLADLLEDGEEAAVLLRGRGALLEQVVEGPALDQLHGQERPAIGQAAETVHGRDAGMLELAGDPLLIQEAAGRAGGLVEPLQQHLDGHLAVEDGVGGAVDDTYAAAGDPARSRSAAASPR